MIGYFFRILSYLLHPIFLPTISVLLLFQLPFYINYKYGPEYRMVIYLLFFINTAILPLLIALFLKNRKIISSLEMSSNKERRLPYLLTTLVYVFTFFFLREVNFPYIYLTFFRSICISLILLFFSAVVNYKLSSHMVGMGGLCGILSVMAIGFSVDIAWWLYIAVFASGLLGSARIYMGAHTVLQLFFGFVLGFSTQFFLIL